MGEEANPIHDYREWLVDEWVPGAVKQAREAHAHDPTHYVHTERLQESIERQRKNLDDIRKPWVYELLRSETRENAVEKLTRMTSDELGYMLGTVLWKDEKRLMYQLQFLHKIPLAERNDFVNEVFRNTAKVNDETLWNAQRMAQEADMKIMVYCIVHDVPAFRMENTELGRVYLFKKTTPLYLELTNENPDEPEDSVVDVLSIAILSILMEREVRKLGQSKGDSSGSGEAEVLRFGEDNKYATIPLVDGGVGLGRAWEEARENFMRTYGYFFLKYRPDLKQSFQKSLEDQKSKLDLSKAAAKAKAQFLNRILDTLKQVPFDVKDLIPDIDFFIDPI